MVLYLFKEAREQAKRNFYTGVFDVMEHAVVKDFFTGGGDELLYEEMYKHAKY